MQVGAEIAAAVTAANPSPVTLRMDKVWEVWTKVKCGPGFVTHHNRWQIRTSGWPGMGWGSPAGLQ